MVTATATAGGAIGLHATRIASAVQMSTTPPSRCPPVVTERVVGDRVLAGICECPLGEEKLRPIADRLFVAPRTTLVHATDE